MITGTRASGKSNVSKTLCENFDVFQTVQAVTTRDSRDDDSLGSYEYAEESQFDEIKDFFINAEYDGKRYGIKHSSLERVIDDGKVPVLILTPKAASEQNNDQEKGNFISIFLDAPDDVLDSRLSQRNQIDLNNITNQRNEDRKYADKCSYVMGNSGDLDDIIQLICSLWEYRNVGGMLPKRLIDLMIKCNMLLENAEIRNISGASYDLTLGDQYFQGKKQNMTPENPFIIMKPGDYVVVSAKEIADFTKDIAARFDLSVSLFCQGIILSNGPQIDPGFKGGLFCLLFNTSNKEIQLKRGRHYATVEFIKLIEPTEAYTGNYQNKNEIMDYLPSIAEKSAISELREDINKLKNANLVERILPLVLSFLSLVIVFIIFFATSDII